MVIGVFGFRILAKTANLSSTCQMCPTQCLATSNGFLLLRLGFARVGSDGQKAVDEETEENLAVFP